MTVYECILQEGFNYDNGRPNINVKTALVKNEAEALKWLKSEYTDLLEELEEDYFDVIKKFDEDKLRFFIQANDGAQEHHGWVKIYRI